MPDYINQPVEKRVRSLSFDSDGNGVVGTITHDLDASLAPFEFSLSSADANLSVNSSTGALSATEYVNLGDTQTATATIKPAGSATPLVTRPLTVNGTYDSAGDPVYTFRARINLTDTSYLYQNLDLTTAVTASGQRVGSATDATGGSMTIVAQDSAKKPVYTVESGQGFARFDYHGDLSVMYWDVPAGTDLADTSIFLALRTDDDKYIALMSKGGEQNPLTVDSADGFTSALGVGPIYVNGVEKTTLSQQQAHAAISTGTWKFLTLAKNEDFSSTEAGSNGFIIGNLYTGGGAYALVTGDIAGMSIVTDANAAAIAAEQAWLASIVPSFPGFELANGRYAVPSVSLGYRYTADFGYAGAPGPTSLKALLVDEGTGDPLSAEITFAPSDTSITIPYDAALGGTTGVAIKIYDADDTGHTDTLSIADVPNLYPVARSIDGKSLTLWGQHPADIGQSGVNDFYTNRADLLEWLVYDSGSYTSILRDPDYMGNDALPNGTLYGTETAWAANIWEDGYIGYGRGGTYRVEWTMANVTFDWALVVGATAGTVNNTEKWAEIAVSDNTSVSRSLMRFTKTGTVTGWSVTITRVGETATGPINDIALPSFSANSAIRIMKMLSTEFPYPVTATSPYLMDTRKCYPEMIGELVSQASIVPWINLAVNEQDTYTTSFATRLKTTIPAGVTIIVGIGNELWNIQYFQARHAVQLRALDGGYVAGISAGTYDWLLTPNTTAATITAGTYFMTDGWGNEIACLALNNISSGTTIGTTSTSDYTVLATPDAVHQGMYDFVCFRVGQIKDIFETVFAGANPIKSVFEIQLGAGEWSKYNIAAQMQRGGTGAEYGKKIDLVAPSHYYSSGIQFEWDTAPSWITGYADQTNFNTELRDASIAAIDTMISGTNWLGSQMEYWGVLIDAGWDPDDIPLFATYEGASHFTVIGVPVEHRDGLAAAVLAFKYSSPYYDAQTYMLEQVDDLGMEYATNFGLYGSVSNYGGVVAIFGWQTYVGATDDPAQTDLEQSWNALIDFYAARAA